MEATWNGQGQGTLPTRTMRADVKVQLLKCLAYEMTAPDLNVFKLLLDDAHEEDQTARNQKATPSPK